MGTETLVSFDIENGSNVIDALDKAGREPNVALWAKLPDYEDWRLILASEHLDQSSQFTGYTQIHEALDKAEIPIHRQPPIFMRPMKSLMIEELRRFLGSAKDVYGMRLGGQTFGDRYIEEAFVYRIR
ncbi:hypothetical protein ACOBR2_04495 [Telmatobacter bradus]|uniref:hypothetical protein n=1 Tax=Telmatobacter bradus TaxID=474953 RepID=UPI003B430DBE